MKNLILPLESKWFDMTAENIKKEDYREINYYWFTKLVENSENLFSQLIGSKPKEESLKSRNKCVKSIVLSQFFKDKYFKKFDTTTITKGYPKKDDKSRRRSYKHLGIEIRTGNPKWGAEPDKLYFVIIHGEEIK
jgi:hypothetical protein